jgi:uracil-DNA glycosylase
MTAAIPKSWKSILSSEIEKPYYKTLQEFVAKERATHTVYPPEQEVFSALEYTPFDQVKVLLLGQDPYHGPNQAHGLCFSVRPGVAPPPSLVNIYKELHDDLGCSIPNNGYLVPWAKQGILMLNAVLTVRAGEPNSHKNKGWEKFTDAIIKAVNDKPDPVVFVLWGGYAQKKKTLIHEQHTIVESVHPSPLSVYRGFFGSKPFSKINKALREAGKTEIDWQIPNI